MCVNCGVSSCSSCNTNSYIPDSTSALKYDGPKFVCPTDFTVLPGAPLNDMMNTLMGQICTNASSVDSVTGLDTDNTDPENPIVQIAVDGVTITGEGTLASPLVSVGGGGQISAFQNIDTFFTTVLWDYSLGYNAEITLDGSKTLAEPTGAVDGDYGTLVITQNGVGSHTLTLPASFKVVNGGAGAITLSTAASLSTANLSTVILAW